MNAEIVSTGAVQAVSEAAERNEAVQGFIMHHVANSRDWTLFPYVHFRLPEFLTVHAVMVVFAALLLITVLGLACRRMGAVPHGLLNVLEAFVKYIRDEIAIPFLGEHDGPRMTPLFCTFFFFILIMNLIGLVPCFQAATANVNVTGSLAVITFAFMVFGAMFRHGPIGFIKGFAPPGVPLVLLLILVLIEIIGLFIKALALMIRLFANMLSGHIVIFSLVGLIVMFGYVALPALVMAVGIYILEVFVSFLQAYIFTLLSAAFIGQRYHPEH